MTELTERQAQLHAYLCERWAAPPTIREMGEHMGGINTNGVVCHLKALAQKGYVALPDGSRRSRGITLLVGPNLDGTDIEIAGRMYRLTSTTDGNHARTQSKS